jgi:hypothetical protein
VLRTQRKKKFVVSKCAVSLLLLCALGCKHVTSAKPGADVILADGGKTQIHATMLVRTADFLEYEPILLVLPEKTSTKNHASMLRTMRTEPGHDQERIATAISTLLQHENIEGSIWVISSKPLVLAVSEIKRPRETSLLDPAPYVRTDQMDVKISEIIVFCKDISVPKDNETLVKMYEKRDGCIRRIKLPTEKSLKDVFDSVSSFELSFSRNKSQN